VAQVVAGMELVGEFEVVVDAEDGLDDLHDFPWARLADL
jgi:hypothetical protein